MAALRVFLIAVALTAPVWALNAAPAHACSCALDLPNMVADADLIVFGTAINVSILDADAIAVGELGRTSIESTIKVDTYLLGGGPSTLPVRSTAEVTNPEGMPMILFGLGASCGYAPELDSRHLLFISRDPDGGYWTSGCAAFLDGKIVQDEYVSEIARLVQQRANQAERGVADLPETGVGYEGPESSRGPDLVLLPTASSLTAFAGAAAILFALRRRAS